MKLYVGLHSFYPPTKGGCISIYFFFMGIGGGLDGKGVLVFVFGGEISCFLETENINFNS